VLRQSVDHFIKRHKLLTNGATVVVGVSGGPDSMALLDYLNSTGNRWALTVIVASVDHGLRGEQSAEDVSYVERYCRRNNVKFEGTFLDVLSHQQEKGVSVQQAARECRYRFFEKVMVSYSADFLALGHHGDDQVETMLMRQVRGSFGTARSGIPVSRPFGSGRLIRPFLTVTKEDIEAYCRERKIKPRRDPTNESDDYVRNRFRHHVLPFLKEENPNVHRRFQYDSETLAEDHHYLETAAKEKLADAIIDKQPDNVILSRHVLSSVPRALQKRMVHLILNYLYKEIPSSLSSIHIEGVLAFLDADHPSGRLDFPSQLQVIRSYDQLTFVFGTRNAGNVYQEKLDDGGKLDLPFGEISAEVCTYDGKTEEGKNVFVCDADLVSFPLTVRTRWSGDRLLLKGMNGSKKVKTIFIDEKVDKDVRDVWPVVVDAGGTVLWLPGLKHSSAAGVTAKTKRLLILRFQSSEDL
jgi:tRNA(Ile)-lysidine synthase